MPYVEIQPYTTVYTPKALCSFLDDLLEHEESSEFKRLSGLSVDLGPSTLLRGSALGV